MNYVLVLLMNPISLIERKVLMWYALAGSIG
jgi:hypothetical protein